MQYFLHALKNYAVFRGRARRKEYWMFVLFQLIFSVVASFLDSLIDPSPTGTGVIYGLYSLALLIPSIAVGVRRLHDVNKSGWFTLIVLVPLVGIVWLLVLECTAGDRGPNQYGPDPKNEVAFEAPYSY